MKILDKDKIQKQNMGAQIKKEVCVPLLSQLVRKAAVARRESFTGRLIPLA